MDTVSLNQSLRSIKTDDSMGSPGKKPKQRKGMIVDNTFVHAWEFDNPKEYLKAVV